MWNLKYGTNELIYETETDSQTGQTWSCQLGGAPGDCWIGSLGLADADYYI